MSTFIITVHLLKNIYLHNHYNTIIKNSLISFCTHIQISPIDFLRSVLEVGVLYHPLKMLIILVYYSV